MLQQTEEFRKATDSAVLPPRKAIQTDGKLHHLSRNGTRTTMQGGTCVSQRRHPCRDPAAADDRPARSREVNGIDQRIAGESDAEAYLIVLPSTCVDGEELSGYLIRKLKGQPSDSLSGSYPTIERGKR